ncbi:receptor-interacting serine/threonine-protein kinase 1-like [Haliotis asinina]|uniref:receptor-interacting serine/threonine-protein kinase 1-like n=1 Tax=Haliotis asinina TaxID=109174 RepID=UPI0035320909
MADKPPPEPNKSVDLRLVKTTTPTEDTETDGHIMTSLASNIQPGLPPIAVQQFNHYIPHIRQQQFHLGSANIFNITNSSNVQIGRTNVMNIGQHHMSGYDESSSSDNDEQEAIEDERILELRRCEREISNEELLDIARHVGLGWRRLIRFIGLEDYDVDELYEEYSSRGLEEVIYQLLRRWRAQNNNATVSEMLYQVQRSDMYHLAQYLKTDSEQEGH